MILQKNGTSIKWSMEKGDHSKLLIEGQKIEVNHSYNSKIVLSVLPEDNKERIPNEYDKESRTFFLYLWKWDVPCTGSSPYSTPLPSNDQKLESFQLISTFEVSGKDLTTMYNDFHKKSKSPVVRIRRWEKSAYI